MCPLMVPTTLLLPRRSQIQDVFFIVDNFNTGVFQKHFEKQIMMKILPLVTNVYLQTAHQRGF
jgi:hypothetical protein